MKEHNYVCFYRDKKIDIRACTSYEAQRRAAQHFKAKQPWKVTVVFADKPISTASIG